MSFGAVTDKKLLFGSRVRCMIPAGDRREPLQQQRCPRPGAFGGGSYAGAKTCEGR